MTTSWVYTNIHAYRAAMTVLYAGGYRRRFRDVIDQFDERTTSICDLCFGDTIIADYCRAHRIMWTGVDLNRGFCERASRSGHAVICADLFAADLPRADVYVMAGSLYHFHDRLSDLFDIVWQRTTRFILSEPVRNLSAGPGLLGRLARRSANPGDRHAGFRYGEASLREAIRAQQARHAMTTKVISIKRDLLLVMERAAG
jgi:hypothetical protein